MKYIFSVIYQFLYENYFSARLDGQYEYLNFTGTNTTLLFLVGGLLIGIIVASFLIYYQKTVVGRFVRRLLSGKIFTPDAALPLEEKDFAAKRELCSRSSVLRKLVSYVEDGVVYDYKSDLVARLGVSADEEADKAEDAASEAEGKSDAPVKDANDAPVTEEETPCAQKKKGFRTFASRLFGKEPTLKVRCPDFTKARFFIPEDLSYRAELRYGKRGVSKKSLILTIIVCIILFFLSLWLIPVLVRMLDTTIGNVIGGI